MIEKTLGMLASRSADFYRHPGEKCIMQGEKSMKVMLADFHKFIGYSGGIENVFAKMASALSERNYDVIAAFADEKRKRESFFTVPESVKLLNLYHLPEEKAVKPIWDIIR